MFANIRSISIPDAAARRSQSSKTRVTVALSSLGQADARESPTKVYRAIEVAHVPDTRYAACARVTLVCDSLDKHTRASFYSAFLPERARAYVKRINFCYTPKYGSWLNVAERELSCLTSQCLSDRRIGKLSLLQYEIGICPDKTEAVAPEDLACGRQ